METREALAEMRRLESEVRNKRDSDPEVAHAAKDAAMKLALEKVEEGLLKLSTLELAGFYIKGGEFINLHHLSMLAQVALKVNATECKWHACS